MTACFISHEKGPFLYVDMIDRRREGLPPPEVLGRIGTFESRGLAELEAEKRVREDDNVLVLVRTRRCYEGTPEASVHHEVYAYRVEDLKFEQLSTKNMRSGYSLFYRDERRDVGVEPATDSVCVRQRCIDLGQRLGHETNLVLRPQPTPPGRTRPRD